MLFLTHNPKIPAPIASKQKMNKNIVPTIPTGLASFLNIFLINGTIRFIDVEIIITYVPVTARHPRITVGIPNRSIPPNTIVTNETKPKKPRIWIHMSKLTTKNGIMRILVIKELI